MNKKILSVFAALLIPLMAFAYGDYAGGVKAKVVNRAGRTPIAGATVNVIDGVQIVASATTFEDGSFMIGDLADGKYVIKVIAKGFAPAEVNLSVEGFVRDLMFISMVAEQVIAEVDDSSFAEFDMDDSGYSDNPSYLFGANDPYNNIVGYGWSDVRFKNRGYNSETQDVVFAGVPLNDAITGYSPYSLWSGLNEATRSKENAIGLETNDVTFGGYNGVTSILATPSTVRPGLRFSVLSNSALYRLRLMANYASGEMDNGWSYAINVSSRLGGNDWVQGVYYKYLSYYAGAEKRINDQHRIAFMTFATPGERGAQNGSTQEVYDLMGDNMYNSNWGYQNGKMRNARVRSTFEPVFVAKYTYIPLTSLEINLTALWRTGRNGYSALDWYDSADPRPDYYRNLPSYFYDPTNPDLGRADEYQAAQQREAWLFDENTQHINWDKLYNINYKAQDGRSKYVLQDRRTDQNDFNLALSTKWVPNSEFTVTGGLTARINRTEYFQTVKDLLGGDHYLNINNFAERDYASSEAKFQYDIDYWLANGQAQVLGVGDKYGYDYYAQIRNYKAWVNLSADRGPLKYNLAARIGSESFWRDGLMRNGLFPGTKADGSDYVVDGVNLTKDGGNESSYGKSEKASFLVGAVKGGVEYVFAGGHRVYANAGFFSDAPKFNGAFLSPRTRNTLVPGLRNSKTTSADINYQYSNGGYNVRATAFYTNIADQSKTMSFYDDSQHSFTNFSMTGIDERHMGIELGFKIPFFIKDLSLQGSLSWGEYIYTSTPMMTQTIDNSSQVVIDNEPITYWAAHPIYKKDADGNYLVDEDGKYKLDKVQKHYVPSTPQLAANIGLNYRYNYWFFSLNANLYANNYLSMNPLYRTEMAVVGPDDNLSSASRTEHRNSWLLTETTVEEGLSPIEIEYMAAQEKFKNVVVVNASVGKSWYIQRKYQIGFSLEVKNLLNNTGIKTGGYEQTRLIKSNSYSRYYRFDSKYFYMPGANYMLNIYFRF